MIIEYHRPKKLDEALKLLERKQPVTVPLGGGTVLNAPSDEQVAVVDLQNLELDGINQAGSTLKVGAAASLQSLLDTPELAEALVKAIKHEATHNLRQSGTIAGALVSGDGRSPFLTAMMALDAQLVWQPGDAKQALGEFVPLRAEQRPGLLISEVQFSLGTRLAYEYVARSPADKPVVCVAVARWPSGRTRIVLGGYGAVPITALDGEELDGADEVVEYALISAQDQWASAEYRIDAAKTLVGRCLQALK
ncbi:MAG: FAD binding domain-containing protein [Chloroflexota bacterium]